MSYETTDEEAKRVLGIGDDLDSRLAKLRSNDHQYCSRGTAKVMDEELTRLRRRIEVLERMDREAAEHVETVICTRSRHFTGDYPYVGWVGLGQALGEDYDDASKWRAALVVLSEYDDSGTNIGVSNTCGRVRKIAEEALKR